ncbi:hypothetical protein VTO42DRAFT_5259 [Malbranchea cinnamomea]
MEQSPFDAGGSLSVNEGEAQGYSGYLGGDEGGGHEVIRVDGPPNFDLDSYIGNYAGRTKFDRLYLIGTCSSYLATDALKMAVAEAKSGKDVKAYEKAVQALAAVAPTDSDAVLDQGWVDRTTKVVKADTERLEHELKGYKNNLIKESIRMGNEDLGQHYHKIGDLNAASKAFSRMRDYCTTTSQIASMHFKNIVVAVDSKNWLAVQSNIQRLSTLQFRKEEEAKSKAKMWACMGLSQLAMGSYHAAAKSFIGTDPSLGDNYKEVISPNDVAVYGGLCALATMDRNDLINNVLENKSFRNFLELEPHIRRAITFFCSSKFRPLFDILDAYQPDFLLDIHLQRHTQTLLTRIRVKVMQQYLIPYSRVTLANMTKVFAPNQSVTTSDGKIDFSSPFVAEVISYIKDGVLDARIDMEKGVLVTKQVDPRAELYQKVFDSVKEYVSTAHLQLLRIEVLNAGLEVPPARSRKGADPADLAAAAAAEGDSMLM